MAIQQRRGTALGICVIVSLLFITACSGKTAVANLSAETADSGLIPKSHGFSFANFGASASREWFDEKDLVTMFGKSACVDGNSDPCTPTAQAAQWAQMVNESRASGHCEGLAVQSANRFVAKASPTTVELENEGEVTHGIFRAFATQFLPEVQEATGKWAKKSINDILNELSRSLKAKELSYTLGVYTSTGGHAVLPYAIDFPQPNLAVIKVYDSNWPGMERYVVVNVETQTWYFSFSAKDPKSDTCAWYGGAGDIDITPMAARTEAQCPFCGDGSKVTKNVLLIRSASLDWKITTPTGVYTPANATRINDVQSRAIRSSTCEEEVRIPEFILSTPTTDFELDLPDTASAYVSNEGSVVKVATEGKQEREPVRFRGNTIEVADAGTTLTVAADNVIARVKVIKGVVTTSENKVSISVGGTEVVADTARPQIFVTESQLGTPTVKEATNLVTVIPEVPQELVPEPVKPGLTPREDRDLSNASYQEAVQLVNSASAAVPPVVISTTTSLPATSTLAPTTTEPLPTGAPASAPAESTVASLKTSSLTSSSNVSIGGTVTVSVGGFEPREWVQLIVASQPQVIDADRADANGRVSLRGVVPELASGNHTLAAYAPVSRRGFRQPLTVVAPQTSAVSTSPQTSIGSNQSSPNTVTATTAVSTQAPTQSSTQPSTQAPTQSSPSSSVSSGSTTTTIPMATITLDIQNGEGGIRFVFNGQSYPDSRGSIAYYDPNNEQSTSQSFSCGPAASSLCDNRTYQVPIGWSFIFDWTLYQDQYLFEMQCPPNGNAWYPPDTTFGSGSEVRHIARCDFTVQGNVTIRTRSR